STLLADNELWPDFILEVDPATDEVIWEWHTWDHIIQDHDDSKANYGVVGDYPGRIDLNWDTSDGVADWMHSNAIDFDPINDQVIMSVPTFHEVWIIDHSTTTAEAASNSGGNSHRGGELMYRWGNPAVYRAGTAEDQTLFYQHDIHWIYDFLDFTHPYYGRLAVFNNQVGEDYSTANIFSPVFDMYEWEYPMDGGIWGPADYDLTLAHPTPTAMYSTGLSSLQCLPNGNFLIMSGRQGYAFELTPENEIVWEYVTPLIGGVPVDQGEVPGLNQNLTFRIKRYPADYSAFEGRDLTPQGWLETAPDTDFCNLILPTSELTSDYRLQIYPNPVRDRLTIEWDGSVYVDLNITDLLGRTVWAGRVTGGRKYLSTEGWEPGLYIVQVNGVSVRKLVVSR
ncbi:MAG: aryl-sulfate sulfotransferase, partial [Lewinella sp.]|nr:aryl-sulfate sulfotransferase [Lewinella sp.]